MKEEWGTVKFIGVQFNYSTLHNIIIDLHITEKNYMYSFLMVCEYNEKCKEQGNKKPGSQGAMCTLTMEYCG